MTVKTPSYIMDFITEICPEAPHLYVDFFNEKKAITDATELIKELKLEGKRLRDEVTKLARKNAELMEELAE